MTGSFNKILAFSCLVYGATLPVFADTDTAKNIVSKPNEQQPTNVANPKVVTEVLVNGQHNISNWFMAESEHFIVYSDTKREHVNELLNKLERFDYLLRLYMNVPQQNPAPQLTFYYQSSVNALRQVAENPPAHSVGLYTSCNLGVQGFGAHIYFHQNPDVALEKQKKDEGIAYILEAYARHFLYRYTDIRTPRWYMDGFAQYFAGTRFSDTETVIGMAPDNSVGDYLAFLNGRRYSLDYEDIILGNDSKGHNYAGNAGLKLEFQARSWLLTHYILSSRENIQRFRTYTQLATQNIPPTKAFEQAFGYKPAKLKTLLGQYRHKAAEALKLNITQGSDREIQFSDLPRSANNLILADAILKSCPSPKIGAQLFKKMEAEARKFPNSDIAQLILSRAQIEWGNPADALPYLTANASNKSFEVYYLLGMAQLRLAEQSSDLQKNTLLESAQHNLAHANSLKPQSAETFYFSHRAGLAAEAVPGENVMNSAITAWQLQPEVSTYARSAALAYAYLKKFPEAQRALLLLEQDTRNPDVATWAQTWDTKLSTGVKRAEVLAEMRVEPKTMTKEWTIANEEVMKSVELEAQMEVFRGLMDDQRNQELLDSGMTDKAPRQ